MSVDLRRFYRAYFSEAFERLDRLERALRAFDGVSPDYGLIDDAVREAHSIRGGAAVLGFRPVAEAALIMESNLGEVRADAAPLTPERVASFQAMSLSLRGRLDAQFLLEFPEG